MTEQNPTAWTEAEQEEGRRLAASGLFGAEVYLILYQNRERALRQALTWCVVNSGETLAGHPTLLRRFRQILQMEDNADAK